MVTEIMTQEKSGLLAVTCLTECVICTLHRSVLEPVANPSCTEMSVIHKALRTLRTIFMKLVRVFLD